jgi:hypothetical protein
LFQFHSIHELHTWTRVTYVRTSRRGLLSQRPCNYVSNFSALFQLRPQRLLCAPAACATYIYV